jgi:hypothetical protein
MADLVTVAIIIGVINLIGLLGLGIRTVQTSKCNLFGCCGFEANMRATAPEAPELVTSLSMPSVLVQ